MLVPIVPIGNSKGIRLPKAILEQLQISDKLDLEIEGQRIILKPINRSVREGWVEAFEKMHERNEDTILMPEERMDETLEWEW
jgi:antitoxin MazE